MRLGLKSTLYSELMLGGPTRLLSVGARGIIDDVFARLVINWIVSQLLKILPFLGYGWATPILAWIVTYFIQPIFEAGQNIWDINLIHWDQIESNKEYQRARDDLKGIIEAVNQGLLDPDDPEVENAKNIYLDKFADIISLYDDLPD